MNKPRIAIYLECDTDVGGQYQYALSMVAALAQQQSFDLYCYSSRKIWKDYCAQHAITYRPFPTGFAAHRLFQRFIRRSLADAKPSAWVGRLLQRAIKADKIDVIVFPMPTTLASDMPIPSIVTIHDLVYRYVPEMRGDGESDAEYYDDLYQNILSTAGTVLTDSELCAQQLREAFPTKAASANIKVLPYCAPPYINEYLQAVKDNPQAVLASISNAVRDAAARPFIFYPASFTRHKNHDRLLLALRQLADEGLMVNAVFSSPPWPPANEVKALITKYNLQSQVTLLSYVSNQDICYLYQQARALVMPTFNGPTNLPPLEAFALGCPVVISDVFKESEQLQSGVLLFDPRSPEDIARAIRQIITDDTLRNRLIAEGHQRDKELNLDAFSVRFADIITAALSEK
ncbi:MAG: glycosyltransferase family 4 protein [Coriobacteriia bacterium]|nr:glycosyltransferase family 4 protein [Coriobacteriia bacterium]